MAGIAVSGCLPTQGGGVLASPVPPYHGHILPLNRRHTRPYPKGFKVPFRYTKWLDANLLKARVEPLRGGVPKWTTGTDCKSVALRFGGSNPSPSTTQCACSAVDCFSRGLIHS